MRPKHVLALCALLLASAAAGRQLQTWHAAAAVDVFPDPASLPAACRAVTRVTSIERVDSDRFSESFVVKWNNNLTCLSGALVELTVTRADGQTRTVKETAEGANLKLIKIGFLPEGNRAKFVRAVVTAAGTQRTVVEKSINF